MNTKLVSIAACVMTFIACTSENPQNATNTSANILQGNWKITRFDDDEVDETAHFNGFVFQFNSDGSVHSTNGNEIVNGNWNVNVEDSNDDSGHASEHHFNLSFASPEHFTDLTEDWHVVEETGSKIRLEHISGGNGGSDFLVFEKN